jgi:ATP-dependent protease ClpP protease subunit
MLHREHLFSGISLNDVVTVIFVHDVLTVVNYLIERREGMKEAYIRFMAGVNPTTSDALFRTFDKKLKEKCERIHLMISSPGGMCSMDYHFTIF